MKTLELHHLNLQELGSEEQVETNGGGLIVFAFIAGMALAYYEKHKDA